MKEAATKPILGIAVGAPGLIDPQNGIVRQAVNLGWQNLPLKALLEAVNTEATRRTLPTMVAETSIEYSTLGPDIVLLGSTAVMPNMCWAPLTTAMLFAAKHLTVSRLTFSKP